MCNWLAQQYDAIWSNVQIMDACMIVYKHSLTAKQHKRMGPPCCC